MTEQAPSGQSADAAEPTARPKRPSRWIVSALLILLGGWFIVTQVVSYTGPPIDWIPDDLAAAEQAARERGVRIFLLLHEAGCPITEANDRDLFSLRPVRQRLAKMVCCRVELRPNDPLRGRFHVKRGTPMMLVLKPGRDRPVGPSLEGKVDWLQFKTHVDPGRAGEAE